MRLFDATRLPKVVCGDNVTPSRIASKLSTESSTGSISDYTIKLPK